MSLRSRDRASQKTKTRKVARPVTSSSRSIHSNVQSISQLTNISSHTRHITSNPTRSMVSVSVSSLSPSKSIISSSSKSSSPTTATRRTFSSMGTSYQHTGTPAAAAAPQSTPQNDSVRKLRDQQHANDFMRLTAQAALEYHMEPLKNRFQAGLDLFKKNPRQGTEAMYLMKPHVDDATKLRRTRLKQQALLISSTVLATSQDTTKNQTPVAAEVTTAAAETGLDKGLSGSVDVITKGLDNNDLTDKIESHTLKIFQPTPEVTKFKLPEPIVPSPPPIPTVTDEALQEFIPPQPSRIIPVIHDGMEWDEPNFLIKPFVTVIDYLHDLTNWPWYLSIVTWAWILRTAISPLTYKQQSSAVKFTLLQPDLMRINKELRTFQPGTPQHKEKQKEVVALYKKHGVSPFTTVFWSLSSMPFYVCSFLAIRNMANSPFFASEFATGGFFPYINLSASAGWELATLNAVVNLIMMHVTQPVPFHKMQKLQKIMFMMSHVMIMCFIPILSNINTASIFYFVANNGFSIFFQKFFYTDWFRKKVGLPTVAEVNLVREIIQKQAADPLANKEPLPEGAGKRAFVLGKDEQMSSREIIQQAKEQLHRASGGIISQPTPVPENLRNVNAFTVDTTQPSPMMPNDPGMPKPKPSGSAAKSPRARKGKNYVRH